MNDLSLFPDENAKKQEERSALSSSPLQAKFKKTRRKSALTTISAEDEMRRVNGMWELNKVMSEKPTPGRSIHILTGGNIDLLSHLLWLLQFWTKVEDFDLLFYSTPCQSISQAGLQHGFTEGSGTRSSIIWNVRDAVKVKRPKFLCLENVKAMVTEKFVGMFNLWQLELERLGYRNFAEVLNAKDYGVPQNRERIFLVSIRDDGDLPRFFFPQPFPLERRLKDVLEENVDERYYLSDKMIECFQKHTEVQIERGNGFRFEPQDGSKVAKSILTSPGTRPCDNYIEDVPEKSKAPD